MEPDNESTSGVDDIRFQKYQHDRFFNSTKKDTDVITHPRTEMTRKSFSEKLGATLKRILNGKP